MQNLIRDLRARMETTRTSDPQRTMWFEDMFCCRDSGTVSYCLFELFRRFSQETFGSWQLLSWGEEEAVTMANKRAQIQKLSDASLGKFDADQSRVAYLDTWMTFKVCEAVTSGSVEGVTWRNGATAEQNLLWPGLGIVQGSLSISPFLVDKVPAGSCNSKGWESNLSRRCRRVLLKRATRIVQRFASTTSLRHGEPRNLQQRNLPSRRLSRQARLARLARWRMSRRKPVRWRSQWRRKATWFERFYDVSDAWNIQQFE